MQALGDGLAAGQPKPEELGALVDAESVDQIDECLVVRVRRKRVQDDAGHAIRVEVKVADERLDLHQDALQVFRRHLGVSGLIQQRQKLGVSLGFLPKHVELPLRVDIARVEPDLPLPPPVLVRRDQPDRLHEFAVTDLHEHPPGHALLLHQGGRRPREQLSGRPVPALLLVVDVAAVVSEQLPRHPERVTQLVVLRSCLLKRLDVLDALDERFRSELSAGDPLEEQADEEEEASLLRRREVATALSQRLEELLAIVERCDDARHLDARVQHE